MIITPIIILLVSIFAIVILFLKTNKIQEKLMYVSTITNYLIAILLIYSLIKNNESLIDISFILCFFSLANNLVFFKFIGAKKND